MAREEIIEIRLTEPIKLGDLRWLVEKCANMKPESQVIVKEHKSLDFRDYDPASITVRGQPI